MVHGWIVIAHLKLKHRQQEPARDTCSCVDAPYLAEERFGCQRTTAGLSLSGLLLDVSQHFFSLDTVIRMAHYRQHLKRCQRVECPIILAKVEERHSKLS